MLLVTSLNDIPKIDTPCGLTIGTFDGVHLGHQSLLAHLRSKLPANGNLTVFTFSNHPSQVFSPQSPVPLIYPPMQKVKTLFDWGVDIVILVPFDPHFAQIPFENFLSRLQDRLGFSYLTLGEGAAFGKGKRGEPSAVKEWGEKKGFEVEYLRKTSLHHHSISSGRIRTLIQQGLLSQAAECLGRPYALMGHPKEKEGRIFCPFPGICLPPEGEYQVQVTLIKKNHEISSFNAGLFVSHKSCGAYITRLELKDVIDREILIKF